MQSAIDDLLGAERHRRRRRASRHPRDLSHVRRRSRLAAAHRARRSQSGLTAEAAVQKVQDETACPHGPGERSLSPRAAGRSRGSDQPPAAASRRGGADAAAADLPDEFVLVARNMGPAELLDYDRRRLKGLVLEEGSPTAHVAVVARALDIPGGRPRQGRARQGRGGRLVVVDGDDGQVFIRARARISSRRSERASRHGSAAALSYAALRDLPAETRGRRRGSRCSSMPGCCIDLPYLDETGAEGIGLFRTEMPFMLRARLPDVSAAGRRSIAASSSRPAAGRSRSAPSTSAATSCCPTCRRSPRRIRRWAGARSASRSTARRCCAISCAR